MAFGARQETDGKWRLCLRKGRTINGTKIAGQRENWEFKGQRQAKACADELNEHFWPRYRKFQDGTGVPSDINFVMDMINCIRKHCI
jgi:hypothetical protein